MANVNGIKKTLHAAHHLQNDAKGKYSAHMHVINREAIEIITWAYCELRKMTR